MDKSILIIDDESFVRQSFADFLDDCLWETFQTESGEAALEILKKTKISAVIVDIRLGGMVGDEFIRKALSLYPELVFLICTGSPEYHIPSDLLESGRVSRKLFKKPVSRMTELDVELNKLLGYEK
ncbi:MAG: response regulator [Spirochaetales bacterium]|nr:response regulator [Spirochaetales bacterium]